MNNLYLAVLTAAGSFFDNINLETVLTALAASGVFSLVGGIIQKRLDKKDKLLKCLIASMHDRLLYLGGIYIEKGFITDDEYENFINMYGPYKDAGGNGAVSRIKIAVDALPIRRSTYLSSSQLDSNVKTLTN